MFKSMAIINNLLLVGLIWTPNVHRQVEESIGTSSIPSGTKTAWTIVFVVLFSQEIYIIPCKIIYSTPEAKTTQKKLE